MVPDLSHHVRALRRRLRLSQDEFAERCGLDRTVITHIESGRNRASSAATQQALARGAGLTVEQLAAYFAKPAPAAGADKWRRPRKNAA